MRTVEDIGRCIDVALRRQPADLVIHGVRIFDLVTGEYRLSDIAICGERIAAVGQGYEGKHTIEGNGLTAVPGFIDAHCHIESSLVTPYEYERCVLRHGITTAVCDPHELANVAGTAAIDYFCNCAKGMLARLEVHIPSCVPALPSELAGAVLAAKDLEPYHSHGLSEMMNLPGLLAKDPDVLAKLANFSESGVDGHAPLVSGDTLMAIAAAGVRNDHENTTVNEALEKLRAGQTIFIRYGSVGKNLPALIPLLTQDFAGQVCFCTDDRDPLEIEEEGHLDGAIRIAIAAGCDPRYVYRAATLSSARHFGWRDRGLIAPGYVADIVLLKSVTACDVQTTIVRGRCVDTATFATRPQPPSIEPFLHSLQCTPPTEAQLRDATMPASAIQVREGVLVTEKAPADETSITGCLIARYGYSNRIGRAWIRGLGISSGAIASSVGHDSHNICVVGATAHERVCAVKALMMTGGGFVVVRGDTILAHLPLPIGGLLSEQPFEQVADALKQLRTAAKTLGFSMQNPFLCLSFLSLPVIPFTRLTLDGYQEIGL